VEGVGRHGHTVIDIFALPEKASTACFQQGLENQIYLRKFKILIVLSGVNYQSEKRKWR